MGRRGTLALVVSIMAAACAETELVGDDSADDPGDTPDPDDPDDPGPEDPAGPFGADLHEIEPGRTVRDVALRYAPIWYHDTDSGGPDGLGAQMDYPTHVDFDGDRVHSNNWESLTTAMPWSALYYALVVSETHFFLTFSHYHPRDWEPVCSGVFGECHEGDMESIRVVVRRQPTEEVIAVQSGSHGNDYWWNTDSAALTDAQLDVEGPVDFESEAGDIQSDFDAAHTHVRIYAQERGHGPIPCRARENGPFLGYSGFGPDGVRCIGGAGEPGFTGSTGMVMVPAFEGAPFDAAAAGVAVPYALVNVEATLWQWRGEIGHDAMWRSADAYAYQGTRGGEFALSEMIGVRFSADQFFNDSVTGVAPWLTSAPTTADGDLFFDPAWAWQQLFALDHLMSPVYDYNPYIYPEHASAP